jgi:hypothetical protein
MKSLMRGPKPKDEISQSALAIERLLDGVPGDRAQDALRAMLRRLRIDRARTLRRRRRGQR